MRPPQVAFLVLSLFLSTLALSTPAHAGEKRTAKREFKAFLKANPDMKVYRRGHLGLKGAVLKTATVVAGTVATLGTTLVHAINQGTSGRGDPAGALVAGAVLTTGATIGAFKLAGKWKRNANTATVRHALKSGVAIERDQIQRWIGAGVVRPDVLDAK